MYICILFKQCLVDVRHSDHCAPFQYRNTFDLATVRNLVHKTFCISILWRYSFGDLWGHQG